ncbi:MAG: acyl-CoA dehydrogenase family protein [bacterium]|nr:acyl-CoA dehydrogenase family protein [bacterium]
MFLALTDSQLELQATLRAYFKALMTPERRDALGGEHGGPVYKQTIRQLGQDGWLGVGWPEEWGGQGYTPLEQLIFFEEANRAGAPLPFVTLNTVGPALNVYGTEEQKAFFLPKILAGELHFAIGYSEPTAGTDLASLKTRAVRDGNEWIVNGQKIWTTGGHEADWVWLATRTDPDGPKHKGITIFAVDTALDGFSHTPIWLLGGGHTNATYYNDMRVPDWARIGEVNGGWKLITAQLNHERVGLAPAGNIEGPLRRVVDWARQTTLGDGRRVIDQEWVRLALAEVYARNEALKMYNWKVAAALEETELAPADASAMKVFGTELKVKSLQALMEVLGPRSYLVKGTPEAVLAGELEQAYRGAPVGTFGGGVNEVQRDIIATAGLGLPRSPR